MGTCIVIAFAWCLFWSPWGGYVAEAKGRSVGEGMIFAVFFGPLGLLIVSCLPTLTPEREREPAAGRANADRPPRLEIPTSVEQKLSDIYRALSVEPVPASTGTAPVELEPAPASYRHGSEDWRRKKKGGG